MNKTKLLSLNYPYEPKQPQKFDLNESYDNCSFLEILNAFYKENKISLTENITDQFPKFTNWLQQQILDKRYKLSLIPGEFRPKDICNYDFYEKKSLNQDQIEKYNQEYLQQMQNYHLELSKYKIDKVICHVKNIQSLQRAKEKESSSLLEELSSYKNNLFDFIKSDDVLTISFKDKCNDSINTNTNTLNIESYYGDFELILFFEGNEDHIQDSDKIFKIKISPISKIENEPEILLNLFLEVFYIHKNIVNNNYFRELILAAFCYQKLK